MPNIWMIGFEVMEYHRAKALIDQAMQSIDLGGEAVTTYLGESLVTSCDGKKTKMPYLIVSTTGGDEEMRQIVDALRAQDLRVDCEKHPLPSDGFIDKEHMSR